MSTFTKLAYHVVFSTKHRQAAIQCTFQKKLYEYIGGIIRGQKGYGAFTVSYSQIDSVGHNIQN